MAKGTFRVLNLSAHEIASTERHNMRLYAAEKMPNVNPELTPQNLTSIADGRSGIQETLREHLEGIAVRKNSVVAIEFVMGASPDFFNKNYDTHGYLSKCMDFIADRYGWNNMLSWHMHFDESTPHVHVLIVPIKEKTVKWKNQRGEGVRTEKRLCARDITGHPDKLRQMHDDFYKVIRPMGVIAGAEFEPRISAEDQTKEYSRKTDYRMAEIKRIAQQARLEVDAAKRLELQEQILKQKEELDKVMQKKNEAEKKMIISKKYGKKINRGNVPGTDR